VADGKGIGSLLAFTILLALEISASEAAGGRGKEEGVRSLKM
jgi:hypothetical protein